MGLASPRGAQFPVFSAQSALAVRLLGLEGRTERPLAELLAPAGPPTDQVDVLRPLWTQWMARSNAALDAVRTTTPARAPEQVAR